MSAQPIYIHANSKRVSIQRLVAIDISSENETEQEDHIPCEMHDQFNCIECNELDEFINEPLQRLTLKRLTSLKDIKNRLSQSGGKSIKSSTLNNKSFNEFLYFLSGEDYYENANLLWENLPIETKHIFVERVLFKEKQAKCEIEDTITKNNTFIKRRSRQSMVDLTALMSSLEEFTPSSNNSSNSSSIKDLDISTGYAQNYKTNSHKKESLKPTFMKKINTKAKYIVQSFKHRHSHSLMNPDLFIHSTQPTKSITNPNFSNKNVI